jgi:chemotaxis response regulator CheB
VAITCLLAIPNNSLLDRALGSIILNGDPEIKVITSAARTLAELIVEISDLTVDIVILGESIPLAAKDSLVSLLMSFTELRVVVVSEDTNWLHIFHKKDSLMTRQADLMDVLNFDCLDKV